MKKVPLTSVRGELLPLEKYIHLLGDIIREWSTQPVHVDENSFVTDGLETYNALWALGPRFIPVKDNWSESSERISLNELDLYYELEVRNPRIYDNVVELVSKDIPTPMVKLKSLTTGNVAVWAKLEWYHPFSLSIKDRVAWYMLTSAMERGFIKGNILYEPTSTNTGLGLVGLANYYNLKTRVYLPSTTQKCIDYLFAAMGAEVVRKNTPITTAMIDSVILDAAKNGAVVLNQFENDLNFIVHLKYTAKEVDYQLASRGRRPKAVIGGLGTSGHLSALSFYFKNKYRDVKVYGVQPRPGSLIPGIRRVETGMKWVHLVKIDRVIDVSLEEAFEAVLYVARRDGILIGLSAGAVLHATKTLIENGEIDGDIVVVVPDHGTKYVELMEHLLEKMCPDVPVTSTA